MDTHKAKRTSIIRLIGICIFLIVVQHVIIFLRLRSGGLLWLAFPIELIVAICGLITVHGWRAPTWHRLSAIGVLLVVIAWALFWPIALIMFLPGMRPTP